MNEIEKLAERLVREASFLRASDIHIVPRREDAVVQFRLDVTLFVKEMLTK
jgi:competence protein ComGA